MVVDLYRAATPRFVGTISVREGYLFLGMERESDLDAVLRVLEAPASQEPAPEMGPTCEIGPTRWSDEAQDPMTDRWLADIVVNHLADAGYRPVIREEGEPHAS